MMEHADYKRFLLSDPQHVSDEMQRHAAGCAECTAFTARLLRFENRLERALRVVVPPAAERVVPLRRGSAARGPVARLQNRWLALAASLVIGVLVASGLWLGSARSSLAAAVVAHMAEEPDAWARTDRAVPEPKLDAVLQASHVHLRPNVGLVSYANSCGFRGHQVPHLVVQSSDGPVTVMVLRHEALSTTQHFDEQGYSGTLVPVPGHGSLAVLAKGADRDPKNVDAVAARVLESIDWSD